MDVIVAPLILMIRQLLDAIAQLVDRVAALRKQVEDLLQEKATLAARLGQVQRRAARQAAPFSRDRRAAHPRRPGRKPGQGRFTFRAAPTADQASEPPVEVRLTPPVCPCCGQPLDEERIEWASIVDIPPRPRPLVRTYRVHVYRCRSCHRTVRARHPDLAPDQYGATAHRVGPRVMATAHVLHYGLGIPVRKVPAVLQILAGVNLTESAIVQDAQRRMAQGVETAYAELREQIAEAAVVHTDDTGWRIGGVPAFLMTFQTDTTTVYQIRNQHRNEEVREVIPGDDPGVLVTDRGTSYDAAELAGVQQQKCLSHVLRSIAEVLANQTGKARWFGGRLKELLEAALVLWQGYRAGTVSAAEYDRRGQELKGSLTEHLAPRELSNPDNQRLLNELGWHHARGNLVRFLDDPSIPPTNNAAEREMRPPIVARKVSHCSATESGARAFGALSSVIRTAMRRGWDPVEWLCEVFRSAEARASPSES